MNKTDKEKYLKYQIEMVINQNLYEKNVIDHDTYIFVRNKLDKLLYELNRKDDNNFKI